MAAMVEEKKVFDRSLLQGGLLCEIKSMWKQAEGGVPDFPNGCEEEVKRENGQRLTGHAEKVKRQFSSFPRPFWAVHKRKSWKRDTEKLLDEILWKEPMLDMGKVMAREDFEGFWEQAKEFLRRVRAFDEKLEPADMGQALRNYMVYAIFLELNGKKQKCSSSIFGYSMLYPYTDNFIDDPGRSEAEKKHYNQVIADEIKGIKPAFTSAHEEKTAKLLADIWKDYAGTDEIHDGLLYMLEAQKKSLKQSDTEAVPEEDEILDISIYKGGLSVLIDRYFIDKPLCGKDIYFYYGFGFLLQLCDDLQDISLDRKEGSRTVFSVCRSREETVEKVNRLLHFTKDLFKLCDAEREEFCGFLFDNCCLLILFSAMGSGEHMTEDWLSWAQSRLPLSWDYLCRRKTELEEAGAAAAAAGKAPSEDNRDFMRILDVLLT